MINQTKVIKLVKTYSSICERFEKDLKFTCQRFSNNNEQDLTDQEIMTIYLFVTNEEQRFSIKQIHLFAVEYLHSWFPKLGSYSAFNNRINQLSETFKAFLTALFTEYFPDNCFPNQSLLDSMPIITCSGKRLGKVAKDLTN